MSRGAVIRKKVRGFSDKFVFLDHIIPSSPSSNEGGVGDGSQDGILAIAIMVGKSLIKPEMILLILGAVIRQTAGKQPAKNIVD